MTARGRVISWNSTTKVLKYTNRIDGVFPEFTGSLIEFEGGNPSWVQHWCICRPHQLPHCVRIFYSSLTTPSMISMSFTNGYAKPEAGKLAGVIYIDNRGAITRAGDQIEDIKIVEPTDAPEY